MYAEDEAAKMVVNALVAEGCGFGEGNHVLAIAFLLGVAEHMSDVLQGCDRALELGWIEGNSRDPFITLTRAGVEAAS